MKVAGSEFNEPEDLRTGSGIIQIEFSTTFAGLPSGAHRLTLENRHLTTISVYLINAAQPRLATIKITGQKRNDNQSVGEIDFTFHPLSSNVPASVRPN